MSTLTHYPYPGEEFALASEKRDLSSAATAEIQRLIADAIGASTRQGGEQTPTEQAKSLKGWVFVAVKRIREAVMSVPLRTYATAADGSKPDEITDPRHPLVALMRNPNPLYTRSRFWARTITFLELTGNAIWLKVRQRSGNERSPVQALWPISTHMIAPVRDDPRLAGWYALKDGMGGEVPIPPSEIVHIMHDNPLDPMWGVGTLAAAVDAMRSQDALKASQLAAFDNEIQSSLYLSTDQNLSNEQWTRLMALFKSRYGGVRNAGTPPLFEGGVVPGNLHRAPKEMAYLESSEFTRDEILAVFGVPPILCGIVGNANRSNAEEQVSLFERFQIWPRCVLIQEQINKDLSPGFGDNLEVEFDAPSTDDRKQVVEEIVELTNSVLTINEGREKEGLPPLEGFDKPRWAIEASMKQPAPADGSAGASNATDGTMRVGRPSAARSGRRLPIPDRKRDLLRYYLRRSIAADMDKLEHAAIPVLRKQFAAQAERIKKRLASVFGPELSAAHRLEQRRVYCVTAKAPAFYSRLFPDGTTVEQTVTDGVAKLGAFSEPPNCCYGDGQLSDVMVRQLPDSQADDLDDWLAAADRLATAMLPRLEDAMLLGGTMQIDQIGAATSFNVADERAQDWLAGKSRDYWHDTVEATTKSLLSEKLAEVMADAPTMDKLEAAVEEVMSGRIRSSARTIARTETAGAYNAAADIVRDEAGIENKEWVSTLDERVRASHFTADGQVVPQGSRFNVGLAQLRYPGDPDGPVREIVNCRCTSVAIVD